MKVLHVYRTYFPDPPGGLPEAIRQIAMSTRRYDVDSCVFTLSPRPHPERLKIDGIMVARARSWAAPASCDLGGSNSFRMFASLSSWTDVIHFHFPWPFGDLLNLLVRSDKPKVMTYHSDIVRQKLLSIGYRPLMKCHLQNMDAVVATSPNYIKTSRILSQEVSSKRLKMIPLCIQKSFYPQQSDDLLLLRRFGLSSSESFVLFIGALRYYKGLHTLIKASRMTNGKIVIAGIGPLKNALQKQVRDLRSRNVSFVGEVSNVEKVALLKACRVLVLPSHLRSEAYGMVLVEASMFAKPMISCEIGTGTSFVNKHEETGLVVPPEEPYVLAQSMNTLLNNFDLANRFGTAARKRYEELFSGDLTGKAYSKLYKELLTK